jgi:hypothetical protein
MTVPVVVYYIQIKYCEPSFALRLGGGTRIYSWTYQVEGAANISEAMDMAVGAFRLMERRSSVNWVREIVIVEQVFLDPEDVEAI